MHGSTRGRGSILRPTRQIRAGRPGGCSQRSSASTVAAGCFIQVIVVGAHVRCGDVERCDLGLRFGHLREQRLQRRCRREPVVRHEHGADRKRDATQRGLQVDVESGRGIAAAEPAARPVARSRRALPAAEPDPPAGQGAGSDRRAMARSDRPAASHQRVRRRECAPVRRAAGDQPQRSAESRRQAEPAARELAAEAVAADDARHAGQRVFDRRFAGGQVRQSAVRDSPSRRCATRAALLLPMPRQSCTNTAMPLRRQCFGEGQVMARGDAHRRRATAGCARGCGRNAREQRDQRWPSFADDGQFAATARAHAARPPK